ncbi:MAG: sel1 repeat family protein [Kiritimatiellae bacterium]|nr:sel1 repeat family protein [Kiritimatiellia bacterium]
MKFTEESMESVTREMCEDEFWRRVYENAPEGAKRRLRVAFWGNRYLREGEDLDAYRACREEIERSGMTREDAHYLAEAFREGAGKRHYEALAEKIARRPMMSDAKLNAAMDAMEALFPEEGRVHLAESRRRMAACAEPFITTELMWKAVGGDRESCALVGDCFLHGHGVDPDGELALWWFRRGALCGDGDCCYSLAHIHEQEDGPHFDMPSAVFWLQEGLRRGSQTVKVEFGYRLAMGKGPWRRFRNPQRGALLLLEATEDDPHGYAAYYFAKCLELGVGFEKNVDAALEYYAEAKRKGHLGAPDAIERLTAELVASKKRANAKRPGKTVGKSVQKSAKKSVTAERTKRRGGK